MADVKISDLPSLTSAGISDQTDIRFVVDDLQSTATTKQLPLDQLSDALGIGDGMGSGLVCNEDTPPAITDAVGLYSVQTGTDRGLYMNTGTEVVIISPYSTDGTWPVT